MTPRERAEHEANLLAMGGPGDTEVGESSYGPYILGEWRGEAFTIHYGEDGSRIYSENTPNWAKVVLAWVDGGENGRRLAA